MWVMVLRCLGRSLKRASVLICSSLVITSIYFVAFHMKTSLSNYKIVLPGRELLFTDGSSVASSGSQDQDLLKRQSGQSCVHSNLELWPPALKEHFKDIPPLECSAVEENWVYVSNGSIFLSPKAREKHGKILCQCLPIIRGSDDFDIRYDAPIKPLLDGTKMNSDFFDVRCVGQDGSIYTNIHSGVHYNETLQSLKEKVPAKGNPLGVNILMFGFDSVSAMNWQRNLPKTHKYFTETLDGIVLEGYNIVGDGTPQALLPILTGKTEQELPEARRGYANAAPVDGHPWIWKDLKKLGYVTQWGEDGAGVGTFTYRMLGFQEQPVDHYLRPFYLMAERRYSKARPYCLGSIPRHLNMLNWIKEFYQVYPHKPKFSFLFHSEYSHDMYNELKWADEDMKAFLESMNNRGHLDNTILILMADHGARFQAIRQTVQGKYEERMPYFSFRFPPKFDKQHPDLMRNFRANAHRLTTPFDIHATFHDIINFTGAGTGDVKNRGISLFKEIPKERTCAHADVEPHWCTCLSWGDVSVSDRTVRRAVGNLLDTLNHITAAHRADCAKLDLINISSAVMYSPSDKVLKFKKTVDDDGRQADFSDHTKVTEVLYQVVVTTSPSHARYEATVKYFPDDDRFVTNVREISRINRYGKQPHCVMDSLPHLRPYCYCKTQLQ